jgi:hypothetical protein
MGKAPWDMRDYGKVSPKFWIGGTGKALRKHGYEAQLVGLYLMTSPHSNMLGLYYMPQSFIAHETGLGFEGASKGLARCIEAGFCQYDEDSEMVWVMEMARYQIAEALAGKDLRIKGVQNEYDSLPSNPYLEGFFDLYGDAFCMTQKRYGTSPLQAPCKPLASQEQEQEQEQHHEQDQKQELSVDRRRAPTDREPDPVPEIFAYWQKLMDSPSSKLDAKRISKIRAALKLGYTPRQLCEAIKGCSITPHNMGQNERNTKYNGIELIFRDADHIDRFIACSHAPPKAAGPESFEQRNARIMAEVLGEPTPSGDIIEMENQDEQ